MEHVKHIHQIFIQANGDLPGSFPDSVIENTEYLKRLYPDARYQLYSSNDLRLFISKNFEPKVLDAYDRIRPFAYKCDLARLCLLYIYGGLYVDLGVRVFFSLQITGDTKILVFRCPLHRENHPWDVENSIMYSIPNREEFKIAIDIICSNVSKLFYGVNTLAPTGPGVIGRALAIAGEENDYSIGFSSVSNTSLPVNFFNYILPNGTFVATRTKDGRLSVIIDGANDYNDYWHARVVYGEPIIYLAESFQSTVTDGKIAGKSAAKDGLPVTGSGTIIWGPYRFLPNGRYAVTVSFLDASITTGLKIEVFDIGIGTIYEIELDESEQLSKNEFRFEFDNPYVSRLLEVRFHSSGEARGRLGSVRLDPIQDSDVPTIFRAREFRSDETDGKPAGKNVSKNGISFSGSGCVIWGPYRFLRAGRYKVSVQFSEGTITDGLKIDLYDQGLGVLHEQDLAQTDQRPKGEFSFEFANKFNVRLLEARIISGGDAGKGGLISVTFAPINDFDAQTANDPRLIHKPKRRTPSISKSLRLPKIV